MKDYNNNNNYSTNFNNYNIDLNNNNYNTVNQFDDTLTNNYENYNNINYINLDNNSIDNNTKYEIKNNYDDNINNTYNNNNYDYNIDINNNIELNNEIDINNNNYINDNYINDNYITNNYINNNFNDDSIMKYNYNLYIETIKNIYNSNNKIIYDLLNNNSNNYYNNIFNNYIPKNNNNTTNNNSNNNNNHYIINNSNINNTDQHNNSNNNYNTYNNNSINDNNYNVSNYNDNNNNISNNNIINNKKNKQKKKKKNILTKIYDELLNLKQCYFKPINELISNDIYKNIFSIYNIRELLFQIFNLQEKNDDSFYRCLIKLIKDNIKQNQAEDEMTIIDILKEINIYINNKILLINNNNRKKNNCIEYFLNLILKQNLDYTFSFYDNYIKCFHIKEILINYFDKNKNVSYSERNLIVLFKILYPQRKYPIKNYNIIKNNQIDYLLINNLFYVYNDSVNELLELYNFIYSKIPKNSIPLKYIKNILEGNKNIITLEMKKLLIDNLLRMPKEKNDDDYNELFLFICDNNLLEYLPNWREESFLNSLVYNLQFKETALSIIRTFDSEKIKSLNKNLLKDILYTDDLEDEEDIERIEFILKYYPDDLNLLINEHTNIKKLKILKKVIKDMNLKEKINIQILKNNEKFEISEFYIYKINKCFPSQIDILIEYVKNQYEYNIFIPLLLRKCKYKNIKYLSYILKYAKLKGFTLPEINDKKHIDLIKNAENVQPITLPEDKFGPRTDNCISYTRQDINVIFIQNCSELINNFILYFQYTEFIGIDTEWRGTLEYNIKTQTSIMQLSDFEGKNILILDLLELYKDKQFLEIFEKLFINKMFIGFDFDSDLENLPDKLSKFFRGKCVIIDIKKIYFIKYMKKCSSFSSVCEEIIGKPLCKYEQCSNWEKRPLRESQFHYAALDALLCCLVFRRFIEK